MSLDAESTASGTADAEADPWAGWDEWRATHLYHRWYNQTQRGEPNDFVIALTASSHTTVSGTGKSTVLTILGQEFDCSPDGFDATEKATVDVRELAYERVPEVPDRSAVVADEIQGMVGTHGLDARRGMRQSSIDAINSILANRDKSLTVILGAQLMPMLDKRLFPIVDAWLMITHGPDDPYGPLLRHHKMLIEDYEFKNPQYRTPVLEELTWPRVDHDDPDYQELTRLKQENRRQRQDESGVDPLAERDGRIRRMAELGLGQQNIAEVEGISQSRVSQIVNENR